MESGDHNKSPAPDDVKKGEPGTLPHQSSRVGSKQHQNHSKGQPKSSRPYREIYRPPSLRSKPSRNFNNNNNANITQNQATNSSSHKSNGINSSNDKTGIFNNASNQLTNTTSKLHNNNSPHLSRRQFQYGNNVQSHNLALNVHAQEFQLTTSQQQQIQNQQLVNLLGQLDPNFYGDVLASASTNLGLYSLQQSKSLGNNLNVLLHQHQIQQQQQQSTGPQLGKHTPFNTPFAGLGETIAFLQQTQRSQTILKGNNNNNFPCLPQNHGDDGHFNRLCQSKSSGSIPDKPRVRFRIDGDQRGAAPDELKDESTVNMTRNVERGYFGMHGSILAQPNQIMTENRLIQKSRTGFVLNLHAPNQPTTKCLNQSIQEKHEAIKIRRSRSFGAESLATSQPVVEGGAMGLQFTSMHSIYSDFQISMWPKRVQETVTASVTAVERVAARQQIEMVNMIFDAMLMNKLNPNEMTTLDEHNEILATTVVKEITNDGNQAEVAAPQNDASTICLENDKSNDHDGADLSTPAVHIFLYFVQKEKDRTVMESLSNACFATFQKLFGITERNLSLNTSRATQSMIFMRFLSCLYSQMKLLRRQKPGGGRSLDEMSFTVLAILCDSCLAMLRSQLSGDPDSMGCLFTVMTSHGRDIECSFPLKMKQLLAAVRDALLGIGPYSQGPLCSSIQKTLMQLIELHAASWALPASAVRYYYTTSAPHSKNNLPVFTT